MNVVIPFQRSGSILSLSLLLILSVASYLHLKRIENTPAVDVHIEQLPKRVGDWVGQDTQGLDLRSQEILKLSRYVKRSYRRSSDGATVILYIGYWKEQSGDYQAAKHSPLLCLPSNGWDVQRREAIDLDFREQNILPVHSKRLIGEYANRSYLFYYWFFTGTKNYSEEWRALLNISLQKFLYGRSDGGIIEISTALPSGMSKQASEEQASEVVEDFLEALYPTLQKIIADSNSIEK